MMLSRTLIIACVLALMGPSPSATAQGPAVDKILTSGGELVTGPELADLLSGHTVYGLFFDGRIRWTEFHAPDGRVIFDAGAGISQGDWWPVEDAACYRYQDSAPGAGPYCFRYYRVREQIYGVGLDPTGDPYVSFRVESIVEGDPEGLDR